MEILITKRMDITLLVGKYWMKKFRLTIGRIQLTKNTQSEKGRLFIKFPDLFEKNRTIKDTEINIELKPGHYPLKQKARLIPLHLQEDIGEELEKLIKAGHLEKVNNLDDDCFVSPVVITIKNNKTVKIALDSRKLYECSIKRRKHNPNMDALMNQISAELNRDTTAQLLVPKIDLDYVYGQMKLSNGTSRQCQFAITGAKFLGYYQILRVGRYTHNILRNHRPNIRILHTGVLR